MSKSRSHPRTALRQLVDQARSCSICPRIGRPRRGAPLRRTTCAPAGAFVAEASRRLGAARTGLPLHGDATERNFEWLLDQVGWTRAEVWVTNAVLCWPEGDGGRQRPPQSRGIDACGGFLRRQLEMVDPLVVAPLGLVALEALGRLAPVERGPMSALAGTAQKWEGRLLMPLSHPSPRVTNTRRSLELQVNHMLALRALVDRHVELRLEDTVAS